MTAEPVPLSAAERWNDDVALLGPLVVDLDDRAVCATANATATISAAGRYARLGALGGPWPRGGTEDVVLRLCPEALDAFAIDDERHTLRLLNDDGDVVHHVTTPEPVSMQLRSRTGTTLRPSRWHELLDERCAASALVDLDVQAQLDTLVHDGGGRRLHALDHLRGQHEVSPISPALALHAFDHLHAQGPTVTLAVPAAGCLMAVHGRVSGLRGAADTMFVHIGSATVRVVTSGIAEAWIVRPRHGAATVELYDRTGRCALAISQVLDRDPVSAARWEHLTAMLSIS